MKRSSTSLPIREMKIKTVMIYHYTAIRIDKIKNSDNIKCWQGCRNTASGGENAKRYSHTGK